ncbi:MAG: clostripain-related cysteine peptidase [Candidatus Sulfobium sp.]
MGKKMRKWTVMVYLAGDNNLDAAGVTDLKEMKKVGTNDHVAVVAQFDRSGTKNHTKRYLLRSKGPLASDVVGDLGETNTGDPKVLEDFILWAAEKYPAEHYLTVIWNHGSGWDDQDIYKVSRSMNRDIVRKETVISDTSFGKALPFASVRGVLENRMGRALFCTSVEKALVTGAIAFDDNARDFLDNMEMKRVLAAVTKKLGRKIDVLGLDACLMNMIEIQYQLRDAALFCVGSEEVEPGNGWPYDTVLSAMAAEPSITLRGLSAAIVDKYVKSYRAADNVTQSACDISKAQYVADRVDGLALALADGLADPAVNTSLIRARSRVQSYYTADYVDLADLCSIVREEQVGREIRSACASVIDSITDNGMVVKCGCKGADVKHSHGISIYFPTKKISPLYAKLDFAGKTNWGAFLRAYTGNIRRR